VAIACNLGFPRIGRQRELKRRTEAFWAGAADEHELAAIGAALRRENWLRQRAAGIDSVPVGDFSFYDHVLDAAVTFGAVPDRYQRYGGPGSFGTYFAMARGVGGSEGVAPLEMTKWFDTNYHYIVPEFGPGQTFHVAAPALLDQLREALELGIPARPVLVGPLSLLLLGRAAGGNALDLLPRLVPAYQELLADLAAAGADLVQLDEPVLATDLPTQALDALPRAYAALAEAAAPAGLMLASYFGSYGAALGTVRELPLAVLHLDLVRAPEDLPALLEAGVPPGLSLSLGVVDGRNVWRTDSRRALGALRGAAQALGGERVLVSPSCSLLHVPLTLAGEAAMPAELRSRLCFAEEKLGELRSLCEAMAAPGALADEAPSAEGIARGQGVPRPAGAPVHRRSPYAVRRPLQADRLKLPPLPTTTIGSFPQTAELRRLRSEQRQGLLTTEAYEAGIREEIGKVIRLQEEIGLDVLVHGEAERNDMVEYFGERLEGFAVTAQGWVQSYGTRLVKPPLIHADVRRRGPMTVPWIHYAQSLTERPVKGMLTGPVTILQWSFARDDQPRSETCRQIALAIREEVLDLEAAGVRVIQIDEPAFREGLPLRADDRPAYLAWASECFRLATSSVKDETQIHSHMCYSDFNDIIEAIASLDADVISIEASRSGMQLLEAFQEFHYPNAIGPGVYDIHSPRVPGVEEIEGGIRAALLRLDPAQLWVNPDCGLKTRRFDEVVPALRNMVAAARSMRALVAPEERA